MRSFTLKNLMLKTIALTAGEPAGIGPDVIVELATRDWPCELLVFADADMLAARAKQLGKKITLLPFDSNHQEPHRAGNLKIKHSALNSPCVAGELNTANSKAVINTLNAAIDSCLKNESHALVTGPMHKAVINDAGILFSGHTEHLRERCKVPRTLMLFTTNTRRVALHTTHLPLRDVPDAITQLSLIGSINTLHHALVNTLNIANPHIGVLGLNPHAGEFGHLGREEIEVITPAMQACREKGFHLTGPLPADTAFISSAGPFDAILAMYHDQVLPIIKAEQFNQAVNVTLGLPIVRTSVDHGTALPLAGTGKAISENICHALEMALKLTA